MADVEELDILVDLENERRGAYGFLGRQKNRRRNACMRTGQHPSRKSGESRVTDDQLTDDASLGVEEAIR